MVWDIDEKHQHHAIQEAAHKIYATITEWTSRYTYWLVGGDFNETLTPTDSIRVGSFKVVPKFIDSFLEESQGIDVWRSLSLSPGFTYKSDSGTSFSRLDYFLMSHPLSPISKELKMSIANWIPKQDHARIALLTELPTSEVKLPTETLVNPAALSLEA